MRGMEANTFTAILTDPPYGINFMSNGWDHGIPDASYWEEALRVSKPGAHLLAFGGTRTFHRLTCAIEDGGWEIRDCLMWLYGSGFPKSHDISKAIDRESGTERKVIGEPPKIASSAWRRREGRADRWSPPPETAPTSPQAIEWEHYGTATKPAWEPVILARKGVEGTIANNCKTHGTGGLNIKDCRIGDEVRFNPPTHKDKTVAMGSFRVNVNGNGNGNGTTCIGRFPANLLLTDIPLEQARYFYCPKVSKAERGDNCHPTVKPLALMTWLATLLKQPTINNILDPFAGSGSTLVACKQLGIDCVGIEKDPSYCEIIKNRLQI